MMGPSPSRRPDPQLGLRQIFPCFPSFFHDLFPAGHDGCFESLGVFPTGRREVGVGLVRVFDEGLTGLRVRKREISGLDPGTKSVDETHSRKVDGSRLIVDVHQEEATSSLQVTCNAYWRPMSRSFFFKSLLHMTHPQSCE